MARPSLVALFRVVLLLSCVGVGAGLGQSPAAEKTKTQPLSSIAMPSDRAVDSYRIYSMLMPVGELGNEGWPHDLYLLEDTTVTLVGPDEPCWQSSETMNPHSALSAPAEQAQDLAELLQDFDRHCHERIRLTADGFRLRVPLRLLNEAEQNEFRQTRFSDKAPSELKTKYMGAPGLSSFSQIYFNAHHTVAMVYANGWCGGRCAQSFWAVYGLDKTGQWKPLRWNSDILMS